VGKQLNAKDKVFVDEYLVTLSPAVAALKAGYSKTMADSKAYQWVRDGKNNPKPHIWAAIKKKMAERSDRTKITADKILEELAKIGTTNLTDLIEYDEKGIVKVKASKDLTPAQAACISEVTQHGDVKGSVTFRFKTYDKLRALELAGKHVGVQAFKDRIEVEGTLTLEQLVTESKGDKE